ncbi:hypothetical protein AgCh_031992 [Apium graveolens]
MSQEKCTLKMIHVNNVVDCVIAGLICQFRNELVLVISNILTMLDKRSSLVKTEAHILNCLSALMSLYQYLRNGSS